MDRLATKTHGEREDEEADRLVRPSPKKKPPRRDRRRERTDADPDLDLKSDQTVEHDPDMSLNYKKVAWWVLTRYLSAKSEDKRVPAWSKREKQQVQVSPKTLKERPDLYEPYESQDEKGKRPQGKPLAEDDDRPTAETAISEAAPEPEPEESKPKLIEEVELTVDTDSPEFHAFAEADKRVATGPNGELLFPDLTSKGKSKHKVPFDKLPWSARDEWREAFQEARLAEQGALQVRTLGMQNPKLQKILQDIANPYSELGKTIRQTGDAGREATPEKAIPALKGLLPQGSFTDLGTLMDSAEKVYKPPPPPIKELSEEDAAEAWRLIMDEAPIHMRPMLAGKTLTPSEVKSIIQAHKTFEEYPPSYAERRRMRETIKKNGYYLDPRSVPPPDTWKGKPFQSLPPDERSEAMQEHRMKVFTQSIIVREALSEPLVKLGFPGFLAHAITDYRLGRPRLMKPEKAAKQVYDEAITKPDKRLAPGKRAKLIEEVKNDPAAAKLATAYLQAQDYNDAREKYLKSDSEIGFTEHSRPDQIAQGIVQAAKDLRGKTADYPEGAPQQNVARQFRNRVLDRLKTLNPEKYTQVKELLQEAEAKEYEHLDRQYQKDLKVAEKDEKRYDADVKKAEELRKKQEAEHAKAVKKWQAEVQKQIAKNRQSPYRLQITELALPDAPEMPPDPVEKVKPPKPKPEPPEKPLAYTKYLSDEEAKAERAKLFPKKASISSYVVARVMKTSVYHGVEPTPVQPYPDWSQVQIRDFADADKDLLLASARKWLGSHYLTAYYDGVPPDALYRAALDLAIHTSRNGAYSGGLPPPLYETLLRDLAGVSALGTLLTQRESSYAPARANTGDKTMTMPKYAAEQANAQLSRLDKLAHTIQAKHEAWGMPFEVAKEIVNDLDRTADEIEVAAFGKESFVKRQAEVILREPDEPYMETFENPMQPHQTDADEPYMSAYSDDQSSAVNHGNAENGRPLAP